MKIVLGGMYEHQLASVADELRAEFPEHRFEIVDSRSPPRRLAAQAKGADLVVTGRFLKHGHTLAVSERTNAVMTVTAGGAGRIKQAVIDFLHRRAA